ncbi:MAG: YihY/virulence factor BrkB family protein [Actinomycetota bacterium]|nr:MAG: YihY/virulence factor BrkB family protein [Actinomycetota bacterium]
MNPLERAIHRIDSLQQGSNRVGFIWGVIKKFGDDQGSSLAALITFFGFTSMFPLLLLVVTVLGSIAGRNSSITNQVVNSALSQFPILGSQIANNIHALQHKNLFTLAVGIIGLALGSQGASQASQYAMAQVWNIPQTNRPNYWSRLARTAELFFILGIFFLLGATLSTFSGFSSPKFALRALALVLSLVVNLALYLIAFRILTPKQVGTRQLFIGSVVGGIAWTLLQLLGGYLVSHQLKHASQVYGFFAVVLGLLSWIYLGARILIYSAEINVVAARRLWPRSIAGPPWTKADEKVMSALSKQQDRSASEHITVEFGEQPNER